MANTVYRGPADTQPHTITALVNGALLPATFVTFNGTQFSQAVSGEGRLLVLGALDFYTQTIGTAYTDGDTGVAYRLAPEQNYTAAMAAATYTFGQELTVAAAGRLAAATAGDVVVAFYDQSGATLTAGTLADVVIANSYVKGE